MKNFISILSIITFISLSLAVIIEAKAQTMDNEPLALNSTDPLDINLYPNPASSYELNIEFNRMPDKGATITVYDKQGNQIMDTYSQNQSMNIFENKQLKAGIYIVIVNCEETTLKKRVVVR